MNSQELYRRLVYLFADHWNSAALDAGLAELEREPGFDAAFERFTKFVQSMAIILSPKQ
jgi:hypothetical protein